MDFIHTIRLEMIPTKKAKTLVDASNDNTNPTNTSTSSEPNQLDNDETTPFSFKHDGFEDEEYKRKTTSSKGKEKVVDEPHEDITTQHKHKLERGNDKQRKEGGHLFPGEPILCQLIQAANLFQKLGLKDILSLTLTCTQIFKQLSPLISDHYMFRYNYKTNLQHYHPKNVVLFSTNVECLFNNPCLSNIQSVMFDDYCFPEVITLPDSVTHFTVGSKYMFDTPPSFNQKVTKFPSHITHLTLGYYYNQTLSTKNLPTCLTHLILGSEFNQSLNDLPYSLLYLQTSDYFMQPLSHLPPKLSHLILGNNWNHPVDGVLPQSLKHLVFEYSFNKPINKLPGKLTHLTVGDQFNQAVNDLPLSLTHIKFGANFCQSINRLPPNIIQIELGYWFSNQHISSLPLSVQQVTFMYYTLPVSHLSKDIQFRLKSWENGKYVFKPYHYQPAL
eukprot:TRINITY_DN1110_c0_g4_i3.p1 TRINITY_DN1110_c0_g4~~TRINITY_DN1110_c0_g4_i3.p1  ORF type:complete len:444 (+),score=61.42 TRINITY_DN1110_c0_g4_i3:952-2283(+)